MEMAERILERSIPTGRKSSKHPRSDSDFQFTICNIVSSTLRVFVDHFMFCVAVHYLVNLYFLINCFNMRQLEIVTLFWSTKHLIGILLKLIRNDRSLDLHV